MLMKRKSWAPLVVGTLGLMALAAAMFVAFVHAKYQECGPADHNYAQDCSVLDVLTAFWGVVGQFVERHESAIEAASTLLVAIFTFTLWVSTRNLAVLAEQQDMATKNLQRPWMLIEEPETLWLHRPFRSPYIQYKLKNGGLSPAFLIESGHVFKYLDTLELPEVQIYGETTKWASRPIPVGGVQERRILVEDDEWADDFDNKINGNGFVFYGFVKYRDVFGIEHETRFCMRWCQPNGFDDPIFQDFGTANYKRTS